MKKSRIIIGCSLIIIQLLSIIGNIKAGTTVSLTFSNFNSFLYNLFYLLGYLGFGLVGVIILISCLFPRKKKSESTTKPALIITILSAVLFVLLIVAHIIAEEIGVDNELYYSINDATAFFVLPVVFVISLAVFIYKTIKSKPVSLRTREKAFKRLTKMNEHLDKGIITETEFEQHKQKLLKKLNKTEVE